MAAPVAGFNGYVKIGLTASPTNKMSGVTDLNTPFTTAMYDVTNMDSGANNGYTQVLPGLTGGKLTIKVNHDPSDTNGQLVARAAFLSKALVYFIVSENNVNTSTFSGYVDSYPLHAPVNNKTDASFTITISGAITFA